MTNNEQRTCDHFDWRRAQRSCRRTVSAAAASRAPAGAEPLDPQYLPEFRNQSALHLHERIPPVLVLIHGGPSRPPARPPRAGVNRNVGLEAGRWATRGASSAT